MKDELTRLRPEDTATATAVRRGRRLVIRAALTGPIPDHRELRNPEDRDPR